MYDDDQITKSLNELPPNEQAIRNSVTTVGRTIAGKCKQAGIGAEDVVGAFRTGLETGWNETVGTTQPVGTGTGH